MQCTVLPTLCLPQLAASSPRSGVDREGSSPGRQVGWLQWGETWCRQAVTYSQNSVTALVRLVVSSRE